MVGTAVLRCILCWKCHRPLFLILGPLFLPLDLQKYSTQFKKNNNHLRQILFWKPETLKNQKHLRFLNEKDACRQILVSVDPRSLVAPAQGRPADNIQQLPVKIISSLTQPASSCYACHIARMSAGLSSSHAVVSIASRLASAACRHGSASTRRGSASAHCGYASCCGSLASRPGSYGVVGGGLFFFAISV